MNRRRGCLMRSESAAEFQRRRAVELMLRGERKTVISRVLGVDVRSLTMWMRKVEAGESLKIKPGAGRPRRLSDAQLAELRELLTQGATSHGWDNNLWTTLRVRELIRRHFAIELCRSHVWHILTDYLGWSAIRPAQQSAKRDEAEITRWKTEEFALDRTAGEGAEGLPGVCRRIRVHDDPNHKTHVCTTWQHARKQDLRSAWSCVRRWCNNHQSGADFSRPPLSDVRGQRELSRPKHHRVSEAASESAMWTDKHCVGPDHHPLFRRRA